MRQILWFGQIPAHAPDLGYLHHTMTAGEKHSIFDFGFRILD